MTPGIGSAALAIAASIHAARIDAAIHNGFAHTVRGRAGAWSPVGGGMPRGRFDVDMRQYTPIRRFRQIPELPSVEPSTRGATTRTGLPPLLPSRPRVQTIDPG